MSSLIDGLSSLFGRVFGQLENRGLDDLLPPPRWYIARVDGRLLRGAQPLGRSWDEIARAGARSVVSLQREEPSEAVTAARYGMRSLRIPITDNTPPTMAQVQEFLDFVKRPENQPVFVHCRAGVGRTGVMVACYRMAVSGWSFGAALAEARAMGLEMPSQITFLRAFASRLGR